MKEGEEMWSSYYPREEWGGGKKWKEENDCGTERLAHGISGL